MKKWIQLLLGVLVSGAFLAWSFSRADLRLLGKTLAEINYVWAIPFVLATMATMVVRTWRWKLLLKPLEDIPSRKLFSPLMIGFALNGILPARAGEFARAWLVAKRFEGVTFTGAFATVVVERIFDSILLLSVIILTFAARDFSNVAGQVYDGRWTLAPQTAGVLLAGLALGLPLLALALAARRTPRDNSERGSSRRRKALAWSGGALILGAGVAWMAWRWASGLKAPLEFGAVWKIDAELLSSLSKKLAVVFGVLLAGAFAMLFKPVRAFAESVILWMPLPEGLQRQMVQLLHAFSQGFDSLASWRLVLGALFHTALLWAMVAWTLQIMAWGFPGLEHLSFLDGLAVTMLISLAIMIPAAPGYWGLYEVGCVAAIQLLGVSDNYELALGYSIVIHALQMIPMISVGLGFAAWERVRPADLAHQAEAAEDRALAAENISPAPAGE